jgi:hypothetical protein
MMTARKKGEIKAAVWAAMPAGYRQASVNGTLPAPRAR